MEILTITSTELQNNFKKYLNFVIEGNQIIITKNGKEVGRFIPKDSTIGYLTDSLTGIIKNDYDLDSVKQEGLSAKYGLID